MYFGQRTVVPVLKWGMYAKSACLYNFGFVKSPLQMVCNHGYQNIWRSYSTSVLAVGQKESIRKTFSAEEVKTFAEISGDTNPLHVDAEYAKTSRFGAPIVHGVLTVGLFSGIFGIKMPGTGTVVLSYQVEYPAPLFVGQEVTASVELVEIRGRKVTFNMLCTTTDTEKVVSKGIAHLLVPKSRIRGETK